MRLMYLAPANSIHTFRWLNYFQQHHDVLLISTDCSSFDYDLQLSLPNQDRCWDRGLILYRQILKETISSFSPDLIHVHYLNKLALLPLFFEQPYILTPWGSDLLQNLPRHTNVFKKMMHRSMRTANAIISDTKSLLNYCGDQGARRLFHVPFGVDAHWLDLNIDRFAIRHKLGFSPQEKVILSSRALTPFYRIHEIIEHLIPLFESDSDYRLLILKFNEDVVYLKKIQDQLHALGLHKKVRFYKVEHRDELPSIYKASDVLVSAATTDGVPATFFEAMAMKVPVITVHQPAYEDYFQPGTHLLNCDSSLKNLSVLVKDLFTKSHLAHSLTTNAYALSCQQVFEHKMHEVEQIYKDVVL